MDRFLSDVVAALQPVEGPVYVPFLSQEAMSDWNRPYHDPTNADLVEPFTLVVHKGDLNEMSRTLLAACASRSDVTFSNDVYVILTAKGIADENNAVKAMYRGLEEELRAVQNRADTPPPAPVQATEKPRFALYMGRETLLTETFFGRKMYLDSTDTSLTPHIAYEGRWEPWVTNLIMETLQPGDTFLDIGANIGFFSVLAAHIVGPDGFVTSIEPQEKMSRLLMETMNINGFSSFSHVARTAVGKETGTLTLHQDESLKGSSSALGLPGRPTVEVEVPLDTVDNILANTAEARFGASGMASDVIAARTAALCKPNVIKMDVEGFEYIAWEGMSGITGSDHAHTLILEFSPAAYTKIGQDARAFVSDMQSCGYDVQLLQTNGDLEPFGTDDVQKVLDGGNYADLVLRKG